MIYVKADAAQVNEYIIGIKNNLSPKGMREFQNAYGHYMRKQTNILLRRGVDIRGRRFKKLKYHPRPPRTIHSQPLTGFIGTMRHKSKGTHVDLFSWKPYAVYHQYGNTVNNLPKRQFIPLKGLPIKWKREYLKRMAGIFTETSSGGRARMRRSR